MIRTNYTNKDLKEVQKYVLKELGKEYDLDMLSVTLKQSDFSWDLIFIYLFQTESYNDACQCIMDHFMEAFE